MDPPLLSFPLLTVEELLRISVACGFHYQNRRIKHNVIMSLLDHYIVDNRCERIKHDVIMSLLDHYIVDNRCEQNPILPSPKMDGPPNLNLCGFLSLGEVKKQTYINYRLS